MSLERRSDAFEVRFLRLVGGLDLEIETSRGRPSVKPTARTSKRSAAVVVDCLDAHRSRRVIDPYDRGVPQPARACVKRPGTGIGVTGPPRPLDPSQGAS